MNQILHRVHRQQPAAVHNGDAVAEGFRLSHVVGGEQHGNAAFPDVAHQIPQVAPGLGVEAGSWLVEDHDLG